MFVDLQKSILSTPSEEWGALSLGASPMMEWGWHASLEAGGVDWGAHRLALRADDGELLALCPLYLREDSDGEYFWFEHFDRALRLRGRPVGPRAVVAVPWTPVPGRRLLTAEATGSERLHLLGELAQGLLAEARQRDWSSVHLLFCAADEERAFVHSGFFPRRSCQYQWTNPDPRGGVGFDAYLAGLSSARRTSVRRERAALRGLGVELSVVPGHEMDFADFWRDYRATAQRNDCKEPPLPESFFVELEARFPERVEFIEARHEGRVVGRSLNLVGEDGGYYGRYWASSEPLRFLHFEVALYSGIERCLSQGHRWFDPGYGGEHKRARGFLPNWVYSAHWYADRRVHQAGASWANDEAAWFADEFGLSLK